MSNTTYDGERIAALEPKVDYLIKSVDKLNDNLENNYVPRTEIDARFQSQGERIGKLENAPLKWIPVILSVVSTGAAVLALTRH